MKLTKQMINYNMNLTKQIVNYNTNLTKHFKKVLEKSCDNKKILGIKKNKQWEWTTRNSLQKKISYCIDILSYQNIGLNDRIMFKGKNSVEWVAWNIATNALGAIWVPLYDNQSDKYVNHIIDDCEPSLFITNDTYNKVNILRPHIEELSYEKEIPFNDKSEIANLIYTSGTTGKPKGVILTHKNINSNLLAIQKRFYDLDREKEYTSLNILPWAHIYGLTTELYYNLLNNNKIAISSGPEFFLKELKEIKPDLIYLVPRILQMIKNKLEFLDKPIIDKVLPFVLKYIFGENLLTIFIGGAQLDDATKNFFIKHKVSFCEGYGCTETSPMISVNHTINPRDINSIGKVMDNLIIDIINNEICVSGPSIMKGYWNNEKATQEVLFTKNNNVYYRTGDEGYLKDGFLYYTGRIKENYKLSNGKFVNVNETENIIKKYTTLPFMIYGDNKTYNIIIIEKNSNINENIINKINKELDSYLQIKKILIIEEGTFQQFMTPKMSLKRKKIEKYLLIKIKEIYE
tara:strand:+ start:2075 stop:3625 length:1551 start_codon:yes stop_codon:yes gene_type:complete